MAGYPQEEGRQVGLLVLLCGVPGCGKDALGRACAQEFSSGASLSQDEHDGDAARTRSAVEALMHAGRSPIFVLRNGVDAADRSPYIDAARRHDYGTAAVWPSELSCEDVYRKAALYLAAVAGCYCRLTMGGKAGHETLTIGDDVTQPAQICLSFLRRFRAPSAPGEVESALALPFLKAAIEDDVDLLDGRIQRKCISTVANQMKRSMSLPKLVGSCCSGDLATLQADLMPFAASRRDLTELSQELRHWIKAQLPTTFGEPLPASPWPAMSPAAAPSQQEIRCLQRAVKVRSALEHLVSPANIASCRAAGSTVTNCEWICQGDSELKVRPAWPASHFRGAPQLRKLGVTDEEVIKAARASAATTAALQQGEDGIRVEVVPGSKGLLVSPVEQLPETCLLKLGCPHQV